MLRHTSHDIHSLVLSEELSAQFGIIADEDAWIELALVQAVACVFKQRLLKALEPESLIDITQFVKLAGPV